MMIMKSPRKRRGHKKMIIVIVTQFGIRMKGVIRFLSLILLILASSMMMEIWQKFTSGRSIGIVRYGLGLENERSRWQWVIWL